METIITGIVLAILIGLPKFAISRPEPYRRLFNLINNLALGIGVPLGTGIFGYTIGVNVGAGRYSDPPQPAPDISPWILTPLYAVLAVQLFALGLLLLSQHLNKD